MKRVLPLVVLSVLFVPSHAAEDSCPPETCGVQSAALPGSPVGAVMRFRDSPGVGAKSAPACARVALPVAPALPAGIRIETNCAAFHVARNGRVLAGPRASAQPAWVPHHALTFGDGSWWASRGGRLIVFRGGHQLWRSAGRYPLDEVHGVVGPGSLAFSDGDSLFLAPLHSRERIVAHSERPLGFAEAGLITVHGRGWEEEGPANELLLRSRAGRLVRQVARADHTYGFDRSTRSVLYSTQARRLFRTSGTRATQLADLGKLGMSRNAWVTALRGGLVSIQEHHRVAIVRTDGSLFARTEVHGGAGVTVAGDSGLVANEQGTLVAFTVTKGNRGYRRHGTESVYLLRAGDRRASRVARIRLRFALCERWTTLVWRGNALLVGTTEGHVLLVGGGEEGVVDLTRLVRRLPGTRPRDGGKINLRVSWA